jgi:DNA polymerase-1
MRIYLDIEGDGLLDTLTTIWCMVGTDLDTGKITAFIHDDSYGTYSGNPSSWPEGVSDVLPTSKFKDWAKDVTEWVGHNFIDYDKRALARVLDTKIPVSKITDTLVLSRILFPVFEGGGGHSMEDWGKRLGLHKLVHNDWTKFSHDMLVYNIRDVELGIKLYNYLTKNAKPFSRQSIRTEHNIRFILDEAQQNGFKLDEARAQQLYVEIGNICADIEKKIKKDYPPKKIVIKELKPRFLKNGEMHGQDAKTIAKNPNFDLVTKDDGTVEYHFFEWKEFNIASSQDVRERMEEAGWQPVIFKKPSKTQQEKGLKVGNPELCEENFATLPETAPESAKLIAKWMMLISRVRTIKQWFNALNPNTGCVHAKIIEVGANTHRMSHNSPNMANNAKVATKKHEFKTLEEMETFLSNIPEKEIIEIKKKDLKCEVLAWGEDADYKTDMRACWISRDPKNRIIVGIDLAGIQLRGFAHYANNKEYMEQILSGDIHTYNREILVKLVKKFCAQRSLDEALVKFLQKNDKGRRDDAKTFIYAYLFGAGGKKVGNILGFPGELQAAAGKFIREGFVTSIKGLDKFKKEIEEAAERGFMVALDGRLIKLPNAHFAFSIYLQSFEAILMKTAMCLAHKKIKERGIDALLVAVVHDELQFDCARDQADELGKLVVESMEEAGRLYKTNIPITGEYHMGDNWALSH